MINNSKGYKVFQTINVIIMLAVIFLTLYPFLYLAAISFSSESYVYAGEVAFLPKGFTTMTYEVLMREKDFWTGYKNTIIYTVVGTIICLFMTTILAYPLSKKRLKGRALILAFIIFTMYFNGGLIPNYLLVRNLGMRNTIWAITVPGAISTYNMIIMRTFFEGLPSELEEAAMIDGMGTYRILLSIILPLSKPIIATMTLLFWWCLCCWA